MAHMRPYWNFLFLSLLFCLPLWTAPVGVDIGVHTIDQNSSNKPFVATHEWQLVGAGQAIPPGLHVRLNVDTGLTEAKLMDPDEKSYDVVLQDEEQHKLNKSQNESVQHPKMLTHLVDSDNETQPVPVRRFRSYEQIKAEFESLHGKILTDSEILTKLLVGLQNPNLTKNKTLAILQDLEYMLHQVDNAKDFVADDGLKLLFRYFEDPDPVFRVMVLNTITAAIQGNPQVQLLSLKQGLLTYLKALLKSLTVSHRSVNELARWTSSCITTLGAQLRNCIPAQIEFFNRNLSQSDSGLELLGLAADLGNSPLAEQLTRKLRIRILTLLGDIYEDWANFKSNIPDQKDGILMVYANMQLDQSLAVSGWCNRLLQSLHKDIDPAVPVDNFQIRTSHDNREKVISAALKMFDPCESAFEADPFLTLVKNGLDQLVIEYEQRSQRDTDSTYFEDMLVLVRDLVKRFNQVLHRRHSDSL